MRVARIKNGGFTLIEIVVVSVIFVTLLGVASLNLLNAKDTTSIENEINVLVNDIKSQQNQAMIGSTSGDTPSEYGVYFESTQYTLFKGTFFSPNDPNNHTITLDPSLAFSSILFPSQILVFSRGGGEVASFNSSQNTVTVSNINGGESINLEINRFGIITDLN